jgi:hypothetical protein
MLPFQKIKLPGRQVGFVKSEVDGYLAQAKSDWYGAPLAIEYADIHTLTEEAAGAMYEAVHDRDFLDRLSKLSRVEDARRIRDQLSNVVRNAALLWVMASVVAEKSESVRGNRFAGILHREGPDAALRYFAKDFKFFAETLESMLAVDIYTGEGHAISEMV